MAARACGGFVFRALAALLAIAEPCRAAAVREEWFLASRNHLETGLGVMLVIRADGSRWIRVLDAAMLGIDYGGAPRNSHAGEQIVPLDALPIDLVLDPTGERAHFLDEGKRHRIEVGSEELLLDTVVNRQALGEPQLLRVQDGELQISAETLQAAGATSLAGGAESGWLPLHTVAGEFHVVDPQQMRLEVTLPPEAFATTPLNAEQAAPAGPRSPSPLAAIIGYDANLGVEGSTGRTQSSLLLDAAVGAGDFNCRSRHLWRDSVGGVARLDTACTVDWPERALALAVGDGITRHAVLSAPVRYGGVRFGTDYALQPYLYTQPVLELEGVARLPSVLEIWIEQQLALRAEVPPGTFVLDNLPLLTGTGRIEAVIVDALGRRTVVSQPFYTDPVLLRPGLTDWAVELGWLRPGAFEDDRYTDPFGLMTWKRGLSTRLTLEARAEMRERGVVLGGSAYANLGGWGVLEAGAAASDFDGRRGRAGVLGYTYRGRDWSIGLRRTMRSPGYSDLAWPVPGLAPRRETVVGGGVRLGAASLSLNAAAREGADGARQSLATTALSMPAGPGYVTLTATRIFHPRRESTVLALYTLPLDSGDTVSARLVHEDGSLLPGVAYQRSPPLGPGIGYRGGVERRADGAAANLDLLWRNERGELDASVQYARDQVDARIGASGAVVVTRGGVFAAPDDGGSFALVSIPAPGARVLHDNQVVSATDRRGRALLSRVRAFQRNRIAIAVEDLPINVRLALPELDVVPGRRQVALAQFDAVAVQYLAANLTLANGNHVPVGANAQIGDAAFPVGHGGLLFAEVPLDRTDIVVTWQGRELCRVRRSQLPETLDASHTHALLCKGLTNAR